MLRRTLLFALARLWAGPNTLIGLLFLPIALITGGRGAVRDGTIEGWGGALRGLLRLWPPFSAGSAAITLGHVVLAMRERDLEAFRAHERVHVRQYERWGPFFLPAYAAASLWAWAKGGDPLRRESVRAGGVCSRRLGWSERCRGAELKSIEGGPDFSCGLSPFIHLGFSLPAGRA